MQSGRPPLAPPRQRPAPVRVPLCPPKAWLAFEQYCLQHASLSPDRADLGLPWTAQIARITASVACALATSADCFMLDADAECIVLSMIRPYHTLIKRHVLALLWSLQGYAARAWPLEARGERHRQLARIGEQVRLMHKTRPRAFAHCDPAFPRTLRDVFFADSRALTLGEVERGFDLYRVRDLLRRAS